MGPHDAQPCVDDMNANAAEICLGQDGHNLLVWPVQKGATANARRSLLPDKVSA
jgi:hypothetical protein